jgi:putative tricarboxylic transport membrane protein
METLFALITGTIYGLIIGVIPAAGATTGLVALFGFIHLFPDPYLGVIFCMAVVAASTTGDTFSGVLLGIPGANSAAASMVDGFPLALQGKATYALTAAITTSTLNGLLFGGLVFFLLPWYSQFLMYFGVPELWGFTVLALATVGFISSKWWFRSILAVLIGIILGMVGVDPNTNEARLTFGWFYLEDGIQLMPVVAGLFAIPEILEGLFKRKQTASIKGDQLQQTIDGLKATWTHRWLALRGGLIGSFIGVLPGLGGAVSDWMAYSHAVASTPNADPPMGKGNIRGLIGPEGANNAQKATSMLPTVLFGIPGASFAAILMALFMYLGFELGTIDLTYDTKFFESMTLGFMWATLIVGILCVFLARYIALIVYIPYGYYFPILMALIVWSCMQYTGGWEDLVMLGAFSAIGIASKYAKISRPSLLIGFILSSRIEALSIQMFTIYEFNDLLTRPIFLGIMMVILFVVYRGALCKKSIEYV